MPSTSHKPQSPGPRRRLTRKRSARAVRRVIGLPSEHVPVVQLAAGRRIEELRILACSDLRTQAIADLIAYVERNTADIDLIVYAGDDVSRFRQDSGRNDFERLAALSRFGLVAVIGNDDGPRANRHLTGQKVYDVHRQTVRIGDVTIIGLEGAPDNSACLGLGYPLYTEPEIARHLRRSAQVARARDKIIIVSHAPPHKILDRSIRFGDAFVGSRALANFLRKDNRVRLVICGHSHINGAKSQKVGRTEVINVASHDGDGSPIRLGRIRLDFTCGFTVTAGFADVTAFDELSKIHSIHRAHCVALSAAGINTISQLANLAPPEIGTLIGWSARAAARYHHLARALQTGEALAMMPLVGPPSPRGLFDIETDPFGGYDLCWCIGVFDESTGLFQQFVAHRPQHERQTLADFLDWCVARNIERLIAYSGCDFDRQRLIIRLHAHDLPVPPAIQHSVDVFAPIRRALAVPISNYRLKQVAQVLGFSFRHPQLDGLDVARQYMAAVRRRGPIPTRLLEYNEDDVRSLAHVLAAAERICGYGGQPRKPTVRPMPTAPPSRRDGTVSRLGVQ